MSSFESLRKILLEDKYADRLDKPLAYWALPNDRRLPLAFLGRTLRELLDAPFEELSATPGIGQKKISSFMKLLSRAIKDQQPTRSLGAPDWLDEKGNGANSRNGHSDGGEFDPTIVSEALWVQWRNTVKRHGLGSEKLGRLAPSLQSLPTVIWHTPLEVYQDYSVAEIRQLKTHGEKRVRIILEVFWTVHQLMGHAHPQQHLAVRMVPRFILPVEAWIADVLQRPEVPHREEIRQNLTVPLLEQVHRDGGSTIGRLAEGRLGMNSASQSVRQQSRRMGVTRARVYQLLEDCNKIFDVRWPEGRMLLRSLSEKFASEPMDDDSLALFQATLELFYPEKQESEELEELAV